MKKIGWIFGSVIVAAVAASIAPSTLQAQEDDRSGTEIWAQSCGNCHSLLPARKYDAKRWESIMTHMRIYARLTNAESDAIFEFLTRERPGREGRAESGDSVALRSLAYVRSLGGVLAGTLTANESENWEQVSPIGR